MSQFAILFKLSRHSKIKFVGGPLYIYLNTHVSLCSLVVNVRSMFLIQISTESVIYLTHLFKFCKLKHASRSLHLRVTKSQVTFTIAQLNVSYLNL